MAGLLSLAEHLHVGWSNLVINLSEISNHSPLRLLNMLLMHLSIDSPASAPNELPHHPSNTRSPPTPPHTHLNCPCYFLEQGRLKICLSPYYFPRQAIYCSLATFPHCCFMQMRHNNADKNIYCVRYKPIYYHTFHVPDSHITYRI